MGIRLSLQKLLNLGRDEVASRPALWTFALDYQPAHNSPEFSDAWLKLRWMLDTTELDAALIGLSQFLRDNIGREYARVCFSADCTVGLEINHGRFCIEPHGDTGACCSSDEMLAEVEAVLAAYDVAYAS